MRGRSKYTTEMFLHKFWERVDKISDPSGCWLWIGQTETKGYGNVVWNGKVRKTHIVSYLLTGHTIPDGLQLAHSGNCKGKRNCCNPDHLTPKTNKENCLDKIRDGTLGKLNAEQVFDIRRRIAAGEKQIDLAKEFSISKGNISIINSRKSWNHI